MVEEALDEIEALLILAAGCVALIFILCPSSTVLVVRQRVVSMLVSFAFDRSISNLDFHDEKQKRTGRRDNKGSMCVAARDG